MAVKAMYDYDWPSRSAAELYGDDQLVHVWFRGNVFFVSAQTFRFPKAMPFGELVGLCKGFFAADPDFVPDAMDSASWKVDGQPITPDLGTSLEENGVGHKSLVEFTL
ncbi:MAG: phenol hydroxylase subunit P4 [Candidatus Nanopelagicales bacterium]